MNVKAPQTGRVYLVGAGPGDPGLLTVRGAELLGRADLVLYDYLANPAILEHAASHAECVCLGRHGRDTLLPLEEVTRMMVAAARAGRTVVRLKGGDPAVFARLAEEVDALVAAGVPFEIVPGITTALAVGTHAAIPLTHRHHASAVALVTGHEEGDKATSAIDYAALARFPGTLVFYMGVTQAPHWTRALIDAGMSAEAPAAIVRRCSLPDQAVWRCTLGEVAATITREHIRPPVIVVVGRVAGLEPVGQWFAELPLHGQTVLVTRPIEQSDATAHALAELGANVLVQPAIAITEPADWRPVDAALQKIQQYDWLVFSSANGVRAVMSRLAHLGHDARRLGPVQLAAIGPATAAALAEYHLHTDLEPGEYRAEALAEALVPEAAGRRFLLARASRGREVLAEMLRAAGAIVDQVIVYQSADVREPDAEIGAALDAGRIDWVTVTSSAIARSLSAMFGPRLVQTKLASISPLTSATLREVGLSPAVEAASYTTAGLIDAIINSRKNR
ncbi:MAG: uroporphyrinogen-III C-methyltransferase [Planctomycetes bacterium]|nr:uroporphyrinogen-III C-methyltransferase [Planctomycetota bacterium]